MIMEKRVQETRPETVSRFVTAGRQKDMSGVLHEENEVPRVYFAPMRIPIHSNICLSCKK